MKKVKEIIIFIVVFSFCIGSYTYAKLLEDPGMMQRPVYNMTQAAGFDQQGSEIEPMIQTIISGFLSILAITFIILMLLAGFNWMTASGDEEKITKAKKTIQRAIIGLVITLAAYSITFFVFRAIPSA